MKDGLYAELTEYVGHVVVVALAHSAAQRHNLGVRECFLEGLGESLGSVGDNAKILRSKPSAKCVGVELVGVTVKDGAGSGGRRRAA